MKQILAIVDALFAESKGKGRAANATRATQLTILGVMLWFGRDIPEKVSAIDRRLAVIESRLSILPPVGAVQQTNQFVQVAHEK